MRIGNHETNLLSVLNKQVDVAVNNTENMERYRINTGKNAYDQVRVLWKSPLIPADPMVYRKDLPPEMKKKIQAFFVNYGKGTDAAREKQVLATLTYQASAPPAMRNWCRSARSNWPARRRRSNRTPLWPLPTRKSGWPT